MKILPTHETIVRLFTLWVILGLLLGTVAPAVAEASPERKHGEGQLYAGETALPESAQMGSPAPEAAPPALYVRVEPERATPGEVVTFKLDLVGQGPEIIEEVTLSDALPEGLAYVPGTASGGAVYSASATPSPTTPKTGSSAWPAAASP